MFLLVLHIFHLFGGVTVHINVHLFCLLPVTIACSAVPERISMINDDDGLYRLALCKVLLQVGLKYSTINRFDLHSFLLGSSYVEI